MVLLRPMQVESLGEKKYVFVYVDEFSRFTWMQFIREKFETFRGCQTLYLQIQQEQKKNIVHICTDHGKEFDNALFEEFYSSKRILHEFSILITSQQNEVVERKNKTLLEMA